MSLLLALYGEAPVVEIIDNDTGGKRLKRAEKAREAEEKRRQALQQAYEALLDPVQAQVKEQVQDSPAVRKAVPAPTTDWAAVLDAIAQSEAETIAVIARIRQAAELEQARENDDEEAILAML
jgi:iron uptake system EfeUOB component EfeO/EfeM